MYNVRPNDLQATIQQESPGDTVYLSDYENALNSRVPASLRMPIETLQANIEAKRAAREP